jgi:O-antigen/teichoic acid export membrane protein
MTTAQRVARNSLVQLAGRAVTMGIALGSLALLSRYLGPDSFGDYQIVLAFLLLANFSDLGVSTIAVRHLSTLDRKPEDILANVLAVRLAFAGVSAVVAVGASAALRYNADIEAAIAVGAVSFPLLAIVGAYNSLFAAGLRMQFATLGNVAQAGVTFAAMAAVAIAGDGLIEATAAYTAGILANAIVCIWFARRQVRLSLRWDGAYVRTVVRQALPLGAAVLVMSLYGRIDILLLGWLTDRETVGHYGFAYRIVDLAFPLSFFFVGSVFPLLSSYHAEDERERFDEMYRRSMDVLAVGGVALVTFLALFAGPITRIVGGDAYEPGIVSMQILAFAVGLIWLSNLTDHALIATGRQSALLWIALAGLVVNVAVNLVLIPLYEARGAAAATVATELFVLVPALVLVTRTSGSRPSLAVPLRIAAVGAVTAIAVLALPLHWLFEAPLALLIFGAGVTLSGVVSGDDLRLLRGRSASALAPGMEAP